MDRGVIAFVLCRSKDGRVSGEDYVDWRKRRLSAGALPRRLDRESGERLFDGNKSVQSHTDAVGLKHETADGHSHDHAGAIEQRAAAVAAMDGNVAAQNPQPV